MSKPSRGALAAGKKKAKKRPEARPVMPPAPSFVRSEPAQSEENGGGQVATQAPVLQFRPKGRDAAARPLAGRAAGTKAAQQVVDYSYVYTDLKIIGVLVVSLLVLLIALTLVVH